MESCRKKIMLAKKNNIIDVCEGTKNPKRRQPISTITAGADVSRKKCWRLSYYPLLGVHSSVSYSDTKKIIF